MLILPTAYWAPITWYRAWARMREDCAVECMESFPKQTLRNRCLITTPHGPLTLSVPVCHVERKQLTRDVEISYQQHWQHQHWVALLSAYKRTPYFDYYADFIRPLYNTRFRFLLDLNNACHTVTVALLGNAPDKLTCELAGWGADALKKTTDWTPANLETHFSNQRSVLDMLMNFGPETDWLRA